MNDNPRSVSFGETKEMLLKRWRLAAAIVLCALPLLRCGTSAPPSASGRPEIARPPEPAPRFSSAAETQAALLELEDRRAYDEAVLSAAAKASDPAIRARAALALGRIGDARGEQILRALLSDRSAEVRAAAAFGCGLTADGALTADLVPLLSAPEPAVAAAAARAIGFFGRGDGEDALVAAIPRAAAPEPRASMLESLWRFANPTSEEAVLRYIADPDPKVRYAAIYALARKPLATSSAALTGALADADPYAAAMAARALGLLGKRESLEPLAAALDSGKTPLAINALVALEAILEKDTGGKLAPERVARVLSLAGDANPNLAVPALALLRQFAGVDREVFRRLWALATTGEGRRRQVALQSVVALLKGRASAALDRASTAADAPVRAAAAESLAYLSPAEARPYRERLSGDKDALVRLAVLTSLKTPEAVRDARTVVNSALTDPDSGVRAAAIEALGLLADLSILPLLSEAAVKSQADPSPDVAIAVIAVCEKLRSDAGARAVVESIYRQGKTLVARLARRSLVSNFRADPSAFPLPEYKTGRSPADYAALVAESGRPRQAKVETARGEFTIRLDGAAAPITVSNFVRLAREKFFDGVAIHRVVPNFVIQDGDPTGTGNGGPGYEIRDELNPLEYGRGAVGMALSGPDTGGSQWFVTHSPQPHLNALYTVFGQVVSGQDVVERIEQGDRISRITVSE